MVLTTLNLHGNHLTGNIPLSLATCVNLKVLDLGNNILNDSFPSWLGVIPNLTVLSLRSNSFHGTINLSATISFSKLQILDLSHNQFNGTLPPELFNNFSGMMEINETSHSARYMGNGYSIVYEDSTQLTSLHFLSKLNLSNNHLTGRIPGGPQFQTHGNNSYIDNDGLCGFPLSETCGGDKEQVEDYSHDSEFFDGFSWKCVTMGYGVGMVIGVRIGVVMILTEKPEWLIRMVEDEGHRMVMKRDRKKNVFKRTGRRN